MTDGIDSPTRDRLLAEPELILGDRELMRALVAARESQLGDNVIDIRGRAMSALEARLDRLESAHENVIAAAYDNQSGMNQINRAVLSLLEPDDFDGFLDNLQHEVADILRVDTLVLVLEADTKQGAPELGAALTMVAPGTVAACFAAGRGARRGGEITLRSAAEATRPLHGMEVASEALVRLDLGERRWPAMLLIGSTDPGRFSPSHGTDLLRFFGQALRLTLIGWLRQL